MAIRPIFPVPQDLMVLGNNGQWFEDVRREINNLSAPGGAGDHTLLTNIGTNSHAQIDSHIANTTYHFTEGSIDHGNISGLSDDDHTQYILVTGTRAFTGGVHVDGGADEVQLKVEAHSTQTSNLQEWQNSSSTVLAEMSQDGEFRSNSKRETKVTSSTTETLSVKDSTYIDIDTAGNTLSLSNMQDGSKMQLNNSSTGDATLNFDIKVGATTFSAPVTMPSGDSYELVYDSGSSTWVM